MKRSLRASAVCLPLILWASLALLAQAAEPDLRSRLEKRVYTGVNGETLPYRLFVPAKYDPQKKYPLIVFLHGAGERGSDNEAQLVHAQVLRFIRDDVQAKHPCFLVAPQCPAPKKGQQSRWVEVDWGLKKPHETPAISKGMQLTVELLDALTKQYSIDPDRRYVTGLSMGGYGSFDLCIRRPNDIAAAVPICGGADDSKAKQIAHIAFWIFHGGADSVVPTGRSRSIVEALKAAGANPRYTEYPGVGHNAWAKAYQEPDLVEWLFAQKRQKPKP